jgi:hypothetical protein
MLNSIGPKSPRSLPQVATQGEDCIPSSQQSVATRDLKTYGDSAEIPHVTPSS